MSHRRRSHLFVLGGAAGEMLLAFAASALISRSLLAAGRGSLARWIYFGQLLANLASFGMASVLPQLVGAETVTLRGARRLASRFAVVAVPVAVVAGLALSRLANRGPGQPGWWWTALGFVPGTILSFMGQGLVVAAGRTVGLAVVRLLARVVFFLAVLGAAISHSSTPSVAAAFYALHALVLSIALLQLGQLRDGVAVPAEVTREAARHALAVHLPTVLMVVISIIDQGWAYVSLSDVEAGWFAAALGAANTLEIIQYAEITSSTVAMANPTLGRRHARRAIARTLLLSATCAGLGILVAPWAIPLIYGASFRNAVGSFRYLVLATAAYNVGRVTEAALQAGGSPRLAWGFQLARGAVLLTAMGFWGRRHGLAGVTLSTASASGIAAVIVVTAHALAKPYQRGSE